MLWARAPSEAHLEQEGALLAIAADRADLLGAGFAAEHLHAWCKAGDELLLPVWPAGRLPICSLQLGLGMPYPSTSLVG